MNSVPPFSNFKSPEDLLAFLLMQKGVETKTVYEIILPMLLQFSDKYSEINPLFLKNFKPQTEIPEKLKAILKSIQAERPTNDLKGDTTINTAKEMKKETKDYLEELIAKLTKDYPKEDIKDHTVTKSTNPNTLNTLFSKDTKETFQGQDKALRKEVPQELNKKSNEPTEAKKEFALSKETISKEPLSKNALPKEILEAKTANLKEPKQNDEKSLFKEGLKEPLKTVSELKTENTKESANALKEAILAPPQTLQNKEDNFVLAQSDISETTPENFNEETSANSNSVPFPVPFWKENKIMSYLKEKKHKRVEKKQEARNGHEKEKELEYFQKDEEE